MSDFGYDRPIVPPTKRYGRIFSVCFGPALTFSLLLVPAPEGLSAEGWRLAALATWMVVWWLTEAVPLAVTALLPVAIMPLFNISSIDRVTANYGHHLIFLFLGGFILAAAMQRWGLHRRIALSVVAAVGTSTSRIILGFMLATAFLSMWISNTATTMMMYAVGISVIQFIESRCEDKALVRHFGVGLMLSIAYSASIGGIGTLIGTPGNALLASILSDVYGIEIGFLQWMTMGVPVAAVMLPLAYLLLTRLLFRCDALKLDGAAAVVANERAQLGPMAFGERAVAAVFGMAALAWITRGLIGLPISDSGIAIVAAIALFVIPAGGNGLRVLDWTAAREIPWGILILFGGGLALASGFESTGLAGWIASAVAQWRLPDLWLLLLVVVAMTVYLTEITSNTAVTATFLPVLGAVAVGMGVAVQWLTVPVALASSMAFMMPVATPPNAIVFSCDKLRLADMVRAGFLLNFAAVTVILLMMYLLAGLVFDIPVPE